MSLVASAAPTAASTWSHAPRAGGAFGQVLQRIDGAVVGGAGGAHDGDHALAPIGRVVDHAVERVGSIAPVVADRHRQHGPATEPEEHRGAHDAEVGGRRGHDPPPGDDGRDRGIGDADRREVDPVPTGGVFAGQWSVPAGSMPSRPRS